MPDQIERAADMAAGWWIDRLLQGDREAFRTHLRQSVLDKLRAAGFCRLECDYDPQGPLLEAVRAAGISCSGVLGSADGILPRKRSLVVYPTYMKPKEGYGHWTEQIDVPTLDPEHMENHSAA